MSDNIDTIRSFCAAWSRLDADELAGYFTDDGTYHNMPAQPVSGRDNVRKFIAGFLATWQETDWEILNIMGEGNIVIAERIDKTRTTQGSVDLPCVGVFELANGKIKLWRDYFDLNTFLSAVQP